MSSSSIGSFAQPVAGNPKQRSEGSLPAADTADRILQQQHPHKIRHSEPGETKPFAPACLAVLIHFCISGKGATFPPITDRITYLKKNRKLSSC